MSDLALAEYIWLDGENPTRGLRSKAKVLQFAQPKNPSLEEFPVWNYDGSSTNQSQGTCSDLLLKPVNFVKDPIRGEGNYLVMCEVMNQDGSPHASNSRATLRKVLDAGGAEIEPWTGFEQEYTLFKDGRPLGFPEDGMPAPQGPYYCGVGADVIFGRQLVEKHTQACMDAGLAIYGINAEVMPGQWEFQIGYRGIEGEEVGVLQMSDHLWMARWLLLRLGEEFGILPSISNKPAKGDWNGAGCHTNYSTKHTRAQGGLEVIHEIIERLSKKHDEHIRVYGAGLDERLTGAHETCSIGEFKSGASDRGCSIRIPHAIVEKGYGYLEDRRPGANCDPYLVGARLVQTTCGFEDEDMEFGDWTLEAILSAG